MSCRFPGGGDSPEAFWDNMVARKDTIGRVPKNRFNIDLFYDANPRKSGESYTDRGGFLDWDPALFDPTPFKISPREADNLDPQQRLLLEECANLFRRAGYSREKLAGSDTGVFIGGFCVSWRGSQSGGSTARYGRGRRGFSRASNSLLPATPVSYQVSTQHRF